MICRGGKRFEGDMYWDYSAFGDDDGNIPTIVVPEKYDFMWDHEESVSKVPTITSFGLGVITDIDRLMSIEEYLVHGRTGTRDRRGGTRSIDGSPEL